MMPTAQEGLLMDTARRGNYNSGEDFVLEYGELRFTFNEADFRERCEQAAVRLGFIGDREGVGTRRASLFRAQSRGKHLRDRRQAARDGAERAHPDWPRPEIGRAAC